MWLGATRRSKWREVFLRALSRTPSDFETSESLAALDELFSHWPERLMSDRRRSAGRGNAPDGWPWRTYATPS